MSRVENANALRLGRGRIGQGRLGRHIAMFGSGRVRLWVGFASGPQYLAWRARDYAQRRHFEQLVQDCLRPGGSYQLCLLPPSHLPEPRLGRAHLGRTCFSFSRVNP